MHVASCPSCGTRIELDFQPTAGLVWCPKCEKTFSPAPGPDTPKTERPSGVIREMGQQEETK
jgi:hypothetical protein